MLKARQALEKMLAVADPYSQDDNLFDQINSLYGKCTPSEMETMHTLRRLSNTAVHGKNISEGNVDRALKSLLLICCWLYFKIDGRTCPLGMFLQEDRDTVAPYVNSALKENHDENSSLKKNHARIRWHLIILLMK